MISKKLLAFTASALLFTGLFAQEIRVGLLNGPSCVPAAYMMENTKSIKNVKVTYTKYADPQALLPKLLKNEADIGFLPPNVAAKVYNSTNGAVIMCAVTGNGNLSLITKDSSVQSLEDLKGKTVYVAGHGATPDYILKYLLKEKGISINTPDGVTLDFSIPSANLAAMLLSGKIEYAVVPEPFTTIAQQKDSSVIAIDLQKTEYEVLNKENYPLTVMVVRKDFAEENKAQLNAFLKEYEKACKWTVKNPAKAGELCQKNELGLPSSVVEKAIPKSNYVYEPAKKNKDKIEKLLKLFLQDDPSSIGGKLPDEKFYY